MEEKVLASIGDKTITEADLERIINRYPTDKKIYFQTEQGKKQLLEQKVAFALFSDYAKNLGMDSTKEYIDKINDIAEQMLTQIVMQDLFKGIKIEDEELKKYFADNTDRFVQEETVSVKHILVDDKDMAENIKKEIESGVLDFSAAAEKYSSCPSKEKGGDLGYFKKGMMVKEFENAAFSMQLNVLSEPVKTQFGYHILIVMDKTPKQIIPFDEIKDKLKEQLQSQKQQEIYENKLTELKKQYKVTIND